MRRYLWIVEMLHPIYRRWEPTTGAAINRLDGRRELADWKSHNQQDQFRLVRYVPEPFKEE